MEKNILLRQYADLFASYLKPQWTQVLLLTILLLGNIGLEAGNPLVLRYIIDNVLSARVSQVLVAATILFLVVAVISQALSVFATYISVGVGWTATNALRADLAQHCLHLDMSFHNTHTPGEMIERVDGDVTVLFNFFSQLVIQIAGSVLLLLGVLILLFYVDWRVGLALFIFVVVDLFILRGLRTLAIPYLLKARQVSAEFYGFLEERLSGIEDIRSIGAKLYTLKGFAQLMRKRMRAERKAGVATSVMINASVLLVSLGRAMGLAVGTYLFLGHSITIGTVYLIFSYISMLTNPIDTITQQMGDLQKVAASLERIQRLRTTPKAIHEGVDARFPAGPLSVEFSNVSFGYNDEMLALRSISFKLQPGKVLGLLGRTGSGKTSLTRLLFRLYDPTEGKILLGDVDIRGGRLTVLRQRIAMVTQDVQLFHATVRDNITFFDKGIADEQILRILNTLGLQEWYSTLPDGLDTILDGTGSLSAGQAQLLAFTRVFLKDPDLLIMDEASSRLDPATEQLLEHAVDKLLLNRTVIIIAHRLATVNRADEIMILDDGHIKESGLRDELARNPTSYFHRLLQTEIREVLE